MPFAFWRTHHSAVRLRRPCSGYENRAAGVARNLKRLAPPVCDTAAVSGSDRRRFQRLSLANPAVATLGGRTALVLDLGVGGALVEHEGEIAPGSRTSLRIRWYQYEIDLTCQAVHSRLVNRSTDTRTAVSHSGLRFVDLSADTRHELQTMMATMVGRILAAQKANARGDYEGDRIDSGAILSDLGRARRSRIGGLVSYKLKGNMWWRTPTTSSSQPQDGFTVAAYEDESDLETLCEAYVRSDPEGRRLIRLVAELSAASVKDPPD